MKSSNKSNKFIFFHIGIGTGLLIAGLLGIDRAVAEFLYASRLEGLWLFNKGTLMLDTVTGKGLSKFLIGFLLFACALVMMIFRRTRVIGWNALFVGLVQLLGTLLTGVSKNVFGRLRPFQLLESGDWSQSWFAGGNSFPSGHTGFYFGLFMPLAYLFPKWRLQLMLIPWFIAIARINANDHFISDIAASIVIVGLLTIVLAKMTNKQKVS